MCRFHPASTVSPAATANRLDSCGTSAAESDETPVNPFVHAANPSPGESSTARHSESMECSHLELPPDHPSKKTSPVQNGSDCHK